MENGRSASNTLEHFWMPFTANRDFKADPRLVNRAEGLYYWTHQGEKVLDGSSGLFCCALGHGRPEIADAVAAQLKELDFASPFQSGHPLSFEVARRVAGLTPDGLNRVFFANSGSEAVETALKIALAYFHSIGEAGRTRFIGRERAYHGVNVGGMTLGGIPKNREAFAAVLPGVAHLRHTGDAGNPFQRGQPGNGADLADDLERFCGLYGPGSIAACFVEPIAGSTGVLVPPVGYLERLREICDAHGILLVFDEVICGFGRTGAAFAAETFAVTPDMITMAKALTNGAQPMGAVAVREDIYDTIVDAAPDGAIELFHGYTYSGHPAACAAALAVLDIYDAENVFARAAGMSGHFLDAIFALEDIPAVTGIRGYGMLAGLDVAPGTVPGARGTDIMKRLFKAGLHVKFTGDTALVAPPLVAETGHIDEMCAILRETLEGLEI